MGALVGAREFSRDAEGNSWILHAEDVRQLAETLAAGVSAPCRDTLYLVDGHGSAWPAELHAAGADRLEAAQGGFADRLS